MELIGVQGHGHKTYAMGQWVGCHVQNHHCNKMIIFVSFAFQHDGHDAVGVRLGP